MEHHRSSALTGHVAPWAPEARGPVEAVIFDFAGVIITPAFRLGARSASGELLDHGPVVEALYAEYHHPAHPVCRWERGELDFREARDEMGAWAGGDSPIEWQTMTFELLALRPIEPMVAAASALRRAGHATALLSNTMHEFTALTASQMPVDLLFDKWIASCAVGMRKPEPEIFEYTLKVLGDIDPHRAVFLDDNPVCIEGARNAGLQTIWVTDPKEAALQLRALTG